MDTNNTTRVLVFTMSDGDQFTIECPVDDFEDGDLSIVQQILNDDYNSNRPFEHFTTMSKIPVLLNVTRIVSIKQMDINTSIPF